MVTIGIHLSRRVDNVSRGNVLPFCQIDKDKRSEYKVGDKMILSIYSIPDSSLSKEIVKLLRLSKTTIIDVAEKK